MQNTVRTLLDNARMVYNNVYIYGLGSNNTAELTAIGEALKWVKSLHAPTSSNPFVCSHLINTMSLGQMRRLPVIVNCDSTYAGNSILGVYNGSKNAELIQNIRKLLSDVRSLLNHALFPVPIRNSQLPTGNDQTGIVFAHVKGHSNHRWNDRADELANMGILMGTSSTIINATASEQLPSMPSQIVRLVPVVHNKPIPAPSISIPVKDAINENEPLNKKFKDGSTIIRAIELD